MAMANRIHIGLNCCNYQRIQNEARRTENSSSKSYDEYDVMRWALGERRGHICGVGRVMKSLSVEMSSSYPTYSQEWPQNCEQQMRQHVHQEVQQQMNENHKKCKWALLSNSKKCNKRSNTTTNPK
ncbi:hypothetical protein E3N88_17906 [Mikania micrantha]|uniref:Uncharacterized protein n=1 Tax=Mikania micrantha TaxID=192012 RepID=A0A5N6NUL4_9ASTR|nr:hypothetical protein E3N88_17906 [Mikania micrantha]